MRKRCSMVVVTLMFVGTAVTPYHALADLLQSTTLTCNDGAKLDLTLGTTGLNALSGALSAMHLYPAGDPALDCGLSSPATASNDNNPHYDYVVGGGQQAVEFPGVCAPYSFSVEAHVVEGADANTASGHFNRTQSPNILVTCAFPNTVSQLRVDLDCLVVSGSFANMSGIVSKATGFFATSAGGPLMPGSRVVIGARDNAPDDGIAYRTTNVAPTQDSCDTWIQVSILAGNITIED